MGIQSAFYYSTEVQSKKKKTSWSPQIPDKETRSKQ